MIKFQMNIQENYASVKDPKTGIQVFVDSIDNKNFNVRIGNISKSKLLGSVFATDSKTLNEKLTKICLKNLSQKEDC